MKQTTLAYAIASALGLGLSVCAQADDAIPFGQLGVVTVTGTNSDVPLSGTNESIDQAQMRDLNTTTLGQALNTIPGVNMTVGGQRNEQLVQIRGFTTSQVPVFLDGIPVYIPYDRTFDFARFTTYDLGEIDVAKGFSSVLYGPNTMGGAINMVSRKPTQVFEGDASAGVALNRELGYNGYHTDVNLGGNRDTWYWQASASYVDNKQYELSDAFVPLNAAQGVGDRLDSYNKDKSINLKVGLTPNATDEYSLNIIDQHGAKATPPYAGNISSNTPYWQWPYWDKDSLYFLSRTSIGQNSYIKSRAYYDTFKNSITQYTNASYTILSNGRPLSVYASLYDDYTEGASTEYGTKLTDSNMLKLAASFKDDVHRSTGQTTPNLPANASGGPTDANGWQSWSRDEDTTTSVAIEDTQNFSNKLDLVTGISQDTQTPVMAQDLPAGTPLSAQASATNPQIGLFYHLDAADEVHLTIADKSRFATMKERYSSKLGTAIANPELQAEQSTNYELGGSWHLAASSQLTTALFYDDIHNMIQTGTVASTACGGSTCQQSQNVGDVHRSGIELGILNKIGTAIDLGANLTYLHNDLASAPPVGTPAAYFQFTNTPDTKLFTYAKWQASAQWSFLGSIEAQTGSVTNLQTTSTPAAVTAGFATANAKVMYKLDNHWSAEAAVNNITDANYQYIEGYPMEGRNFVVNGTYKF